MEEKSVGSLQLAVFEVLSAEGREESWQLAFENDRVGGDVFGCWGSGITPTYGRQ